MEMIVPAVGSTVCGPLGVAHLPRMWLKAVLKATDRLPEGWFSSNRGMDKRVIDNLGLPAEEFFAFLSEVPTYPQTEAWVSARSDKLDAASLAAHNEAVASFKVPQENGVPRRAALGIEHTDIWEGIRLNDFDDWNCLHAAVTQDRGAKRTPIVPLVSAHTVGTLGVAGLPRLWAKAIIHGAGALPDQYRSGAVRVVYTDGRPAMVPAPGGVDAAVLEHLGLDLDATSAYLLAEAPSYLAFEDWVRANATRLESATVAAHNAGPWQVDGERPAAELARIGFGHVPVPCNTFSYNDYGDWSLLHAQLAEVRGATA